MKVTPVQESLENKVPTIAAEIPEIKAVVPIGIQDPFSVLKECGVQASVQFAFQIEDLAAKVNPKMINPEMDTIFIMVKMVCRILLFFTPRVFR